MRVLILDDHPLLRRAIKGVVHDSIPVAIPIEAATAEEAIRIVKHEAVELAIVDIMLPDHSGLTVLRTIKRLHPQTKCLILTVRDEPWNVRLAMAHGASGYVIKGLPVDDLHKAIQTVLSGGRYMPKVETALSLSDSGRTGASWQWPPLSVREIEVLTSLGKGRTVSQTASQLKLSVKTISTYRTRLLEKLQVRTTADLIRYAVEHGFVN